MEERHQDAAAAADALVGLLAERLAPMLASEVSATVVEQLGGSAELLEKPRATEWMDHTECAEYLRTTPAALYKLPVPHHKLGGRRLYLTP